MTEQPTLEKTPPEALPKKRRRVGLFFILVLFIILGAAIACGYIFFNKNNLATTDAIAKLEKQSTENRDGILQMQKSLEDLRPVSQKLQTLAEQQQQLIADWHQAKQGDVNKWHVAEAQYLVKLADDHLQYFHDSKLALLLLQRAEAILQNLPDNNLNELRHSLSANINQLQNVAPSDITSIYSQLTALDNQFDSLPMPANPLKQEAERATLNAPSTSLPWWKAGLASSLEALRKIVIVRYNGSNGLPLVMPEEKMFLYQNLHAQLESAIWGLLHNNPTIYQSSLVRVSAWIKQYFVQEANETKAILATLDSLQKGTIDSSVTNLSSTLQLFDHYLAQASQQQ